jgi:hypothetical protein
MKRKPLVEFSAAPLAEHKRREAVSAPPLKWRRQAALAHCCSRDTLIVEEATKVGIYPRNEVFNVGALGLRDLSNNIQEGCVGELTLFCSSIAGSSVQNVSSASIDGRVVSCNMASLLSIPWEFSLGVLFRFDVLTSIAMSLVPRAYSLVTHSITLGLDPFWRTFDAFMPLGAILKVK